MKTGFKYINYILLGTALAGTVACNKKLDVVPSTQIVPDQIATSDDVKATLLGGYKSLQDPSAYGEQYLLVPDLLAADNDLQWVGTFAPYRDVNLKQQVVNNSLASAIWDRSYQTINSMNLVISKLGLLSAAERPAVEAEAKFMRAISYFELAGLYGKPYSAGINNETVPLVLTPVVTESDVPNSIQPRATIDALFKQVISDLQAAAAALPKDNAPRAGRYAAFAFLARVYLAQGNYQQAAIAADSVISKGSYSLTATFARAFNNSNWSSEDIFAINQTAQSNAGTSNNGLVTFYSIDQRGDIYVPEEQLELYEDQDERKAFYTESDGSYYTDKWSTLYGTIPVVRLAEMYLTRAEANLRNNSNIGGSPLDDVNAVRGRSNASILSSVTPEDVVKERLRELAFEGDKFRTVKRLKKNVGNRPYDDNKLVLPVPQRERDVNPKLSQNPGY